MRKLKLKYGLEDWRGKIGEEVNNNSIAEIAQAFSNYLFERNESGERIKVAVGYDTRKTSKEFALLFARILSGNSIVSLLSEKSGISPAVSNYVRSNKLNAGVIITGGHKSVDYNGIKFKDFYGGPFSCADSISIENYLGESLVQADDEFIHQVDIRSRYYESIEPLIDFEAIRHSGIKILIDSMSAAGQQILENLFFKHDIDSKTIFKIAEHDFSQRIPLVIEENLLPLKNELAKTNKYSFGIATDGDGERLGIMTESGEWVSQQELSILLADYILNDRGISGDIVKTATLSDKIKIITEPLNRKITETNLGFRYVTELLIKNDIAFGCEENGTFSFKNHIPDSDGVFFALLVTEMLARSGCKKLSDLINLKRKIYGEIFFKREKLIIEESQRSLFTQISNSPLSALGEFKVRGVKLFNGRKENKTAIKFILEGDFKWVVIRISESNPTIKIFAEGNSIDEVDRLIALTKNIFS